MELSEEEMHDALSAAVREHLTQKEDLRNEINAHSDSRSVRNSDSGSNYSLYHHEAMQGNLKPSERRIITSEQRKVDEFAHLRRTPFHSEHRFPEKRLVSRLDRIDEHHVHHLPLASYDPRFEPPAFQRQVEHYDQDNFSYNISHRNLPPPRDWYSRADHRPLSPLFSKFSPPPGNRHFQNEMDCLFRKKPVYIDDRVIEQPMMKRFSERPPNFWSESGNRMRSSAPTPHFSMHDSEIDKSPVQLNPSLSHKKPRRLRSTSSRVIPSTSKPEESFDTLLQQHERRRIQRSLYSQNDTGEVGQFEAEKYITEAKSNQTQQFKKVSLTESSSQNTLLSSDLQIFTRTPGIGEKILLGHLFQSSSAASESLSSLDNVHLETLPRHTWSDEGAFKNVTACEILPQTPSLSTQSKSYQDSSFRAICEPNTSLIQDNDIFDKSIVPHETPLFDDEGKQSPDHPHVEKNDEEDDDDDDEELLKLRLVALSSAYNRNVDIVNEDNDIIDHLQEEEDIVETKSRKKKAKPYKEKNKKDGKTDSLRQPRSHVSSKDKLGKPNSKKSEIVHAKAPISLIKKLKCSPKDMTDPKILTLGNEVMRKKSLQDQGLLREIRKLDDVGEGCKKFLDLIKSKDDRDKKKLSKKVDVENNEPTNLVTNHAVDNYDEVEMEVENQIESTNPILTESHDTGFSEKESNLTDQPVPPGTEDDTADNGHDQTPSQESIWELLDKPLENPPLNNIKSQSDAEMLISSIRASVDQKLRSSRPLSPVLSDPHIEASSPDVVDVNNTDLDIDSPMEFHHAFEPTIVADPYPAMTTELSLTVKDDLTSAVLDCNATEGSFEAGNLQVKSISESNLLPSAHSDSNIQVGTHQGTVEDENELRERLLKDLARRRTIKDIPTDAQAARIPSFVPSKPTPQSMFLQRQGYAVNRLAAKYRVKRYRQNKQVLKKRNILAERKKKADGKCSSLKTWYKMYKKKNIRKRMKKKQRFLSGPRKEQKALETLPIPAKISNKANDLSQQKHPLQENQNTSSSWENDLDAQRVTSQCLPATSVKQTKSDSPSVTPTSSGHANVLSDAVPSTAFSSTILVTRHQTTNTKPSVHQPVKQVQRISNQRMVHPPVVINLDHSSDDEDHHLPSSQYTSSSWTVTSTSLRNESSKFPPSQTIPGRFYETQHNQIDKTEGSRKRKVQSDVTAVLKCLRTKTSSQNIDNVSTVDSINTIVSSKKCDSKSAVENQVDLTTRLRNDLTTKLRNEQAQVEGKLNVLRGLLKRDVTQLTRYRQQKQSKEDEIEEFRNDIETLKNKLAEKEKELIMSRNELKKITGNAKEANLIMKKRQKLEERFLNRIKEIKKELSVQSASTDPSTKDIVINEEEALNSEEKVLNQELQQMQSVRDGVENPSPPQASAQTEKTEPVIGQKSSIEVARSTTVEDSPQSDSLQTTSAQLSPRVDLATATTLQPKRLTEERRKQKERLQKEIQKEKILLFEKTRALKLQEEKARLRQTEIKLKLLKQKYKQAGKSRKVTKLLTTSSHRIARPNISFTSDQQIPIKSTSRRKSAELFKKSLQILQKHHLPDTSRPSAIGTPKPRPKKRNANEFQSRVDRVSTESDGKVSANSTKNEAISTLSERFDFRRETHDAITPVTPILKRTRSERRSSSSSVTTPTGGGSHDNDTVPPSAGQAELKLPKLNASSLSMLRSKLQSLLSVKRLTFPSYDVTEYSAIIGMFPLPTNFSDWKVDIGEISRLTNKTSFVKHRPHTSLQGSKYESSLKCFRSYRLSQFFRTRSKLSISSPTFAHKIHPDKILCRYDLTGKCHDAKCPAQHFKEINLSPNEIYLDLLWYCPTLLKTSDGREVSPSDPLDVQLKAAEDTVERLCGVVKSQSTDKDKSFEDVCIFLIDVINRALGNKLHTIVLGRRSLMMQPIFNGDADVNDDDLLCKERNKTTPMSLLEIDGESDEETRYFTDDRHCLSNIERLNLLLKDNPDDETTRVELAHAHLYQAKNDHRDRNVELALHVLCLGIELNDMSERLWAAYLPILRFHHGNDALDNNELEIVDQALLLLPLSKPLWDEVLKWDWPYEMLEARYQQSIHNLIIREQIWSSEDHSHLAAVQRSFAYYSTWLLHAIVEHSHLVLHAKGKIETRKVLMKTLNLLMEIRKGESELNGGDFPLRQEDIGKLWLVYIHLFEFGYLPISIYDGSLSIHKFGMRSYISEVTLPFTSSHTFLQKPDKLRALFKAALKCSSDPSEDEKTNAQSNFHIYRSFINLEASLENWDCVSDICNKLLLLFSNDDVTALWITWIEAITRSNDTVLITQRFDEAVTTCPRSAKLSYMAAIYQLNSKNKDVEAALQYLESCIRSLVDIEEQENFSATEMHQLYRRLLKQDTSLKTSSPLKLCDGVTKEDLEKEKSYLWLIYCILSDLARHQDGDFPDNTSVSDYYEAAVHIVTSEDDRKAIWIQYILYLRSVAVDVMSKNLKDSPSNQIHDLKREQLVCVKKLMSVVRRCLQTTPSTYNIERTEEDSGLLNEQRKFTDFSFHNQISSIFLSCFTKHHKSTALAMLTNAMPTNLSMLSESALHHFAEGDHVSITSLLWGVTSPYLGEKGNCMDDKLWRMAAAALIAEGKHNKALRLYRDALALLPRCRSLWRDAIAHALCYGNAEELERMNTHCKKYVGSTVDSIMKKLLDFCK